MSTTLAERTARKYHGKFAADYFAKRRTQIRWAIENEAVETLLTGMAPGSTVLDVPVGEGRFLKLYKKLGLQATGIDISEDMLALAKQKRSATILRIGDASSLSFEDRSFDTVVCVRFLDLLDEKAMRAVMHEICRVARSTIVLTIRLGDKYVLKSNTATHDTLLWRALIRRQGWQLANELPVFKQGWHVIKLQIAAVKE